MAVHNDNVRNQPICSEENRDCQHHIHHIDFAIKRRIAHHCVFYEVQKHIWDVKCEVQKGSNGEYFVHEDQREDPSQSAEFRHPDPRWAVHRPRRGHTLQIGPHWHCALSNWWQNRQMNFDFGFWRADRSALTLAWSVPNLTKNLSNFRHNHGIKHSLLILNRDQYILFIRFAAI